MSRRILVSLFVIPALLFSCPSGQDSVVHGATLMQPAPSVTVPARPPCPEDMVLIEGDFCPNVRQECTKWMDDASKPYARCATYKPSVCLGSRVPMRFCMDLEEYTPAKDIVPDGDVSWTEAKEVCEAMGRRLCGESEWTFACEGNEMRPYPYGLERDSTICNIDQQDLVEGDHLRDGREPTPENPRCLSPFGVHNMVGNIDEWVILDKPHYSARNHGRRMMSGLKGGWWGPLRNRCRPVTVDHDEHFHELQTGFRCCGSARH